MTIGDIRKANNQTPTAFDHVEIERGETVADATLRSDDAIALMTAVCSYINTGEFEFVKGGDRWATLKAI